MYSAAMSRVQACGLVASGCRSAAQRPATSNKGNLVRMVPGSLVLNFCQRRTISIQSGGTEATVSGRVPRCWWLPVSGSGMKPFAARTRDILKNPRRRALDAGWSATRSCSSSRVTSFRCGLPALSRASSTEERTSSGCDFGEVSQRSSSVQTCSSAGSTAPWPKTKSASRRSLAIWTQWCSRRCPPKR